MPQLTIEKCNKTRRWICIFLFVHFEHVCTGTRTTSVIVPQLLSTPFILYFFRQLCTWVWWILVMFTSNIHWCSPSPAETLPNKKSFYFRVFCIYMCDPPEFCQGFFHEHGRSLFTGAWAAYQWQRYFKKWHFFSLRHLAVSSHGLIPLLWWNVGARSYAGLGNSWNECHGAIVSSMPLHSPSWALEAVKQMTYLGLSLTLWPPPTTMRSFYMCVCKND